jgi:hypothetical protein
VRCLLGGWLRFRMVSCRFMAECQLIVQAHVPTALQTVLPTELARIGSLIAKGGALAKGQMQPLYG